MIIKVLRHSCNAWNLVELSNSIENRTTPSLTKCPFYFKRWNAHWFTFHGLRIIIGDFK